MKKLRAGVKRLAAGATTRLVGYARVSTDGQGLEPQLLELAGAGCVSIAEEHASGADRERPVLAGLVRGIVAGETLVVVRLDRLARSASHLLSVIEELEAKGAHFRSLHDPVDTTTPQGMFMLQVLGAVAQLERALIAERTVAGLVFARSEGRIGGNPGLRAGDVAAIAKVHASKNANYLRKLKEESAGWMPTVERLRPGQPWDDVVRVLNHGRVGRDLWNVSRLRRSVMRLVSEGLASAELLGRSEHQGADERLMRLVAGIKTAAPARTLSEIGAQLEVMGERTPRGGVRWYPSSVKHLLGRWEKQQAAGFSD